MMPKSTLRAIRAAKKAEMGERLRRIRAGLDEPAPARRVPPRADPSPVIAENRRRAQAERPSLYWSEPA